MQCIAQLAAKKMADQDYDTKLALLETIISDGITRLLQEAKQNDHFTSPYGRAAAPTPLITEQQFVKAGGLASCLPDEPDFSFQYGFNPLQYLSEFITWSHPDSVEARRQDKLNAASRLMERRRHADVQLNTAVELKAEVAHCRSGIYWGPIVSAVPTEPQIDSNGNVISPLSTAIIMCKPYITGTVTVQLSSSSDFSAIEHTVTQATTLKKGSQEGDEHVPLEDILPVKVTVTGLKQGVQYYVRCTLFDTLKPSPGEAEALDDASEFRDSDEEASIAIAETPEELSGVGASGEPEDVGPVHYQQSSFWTLPSEELPDTAGDNALAADGTFPSTPLSLVCFGQHFSVSGHLRATEVDNEEVVDVLERGAPLYSCLLGDLLYTTNNKHSDEEGPERSAVLTDSLVSALYSKTALFAQETSSLMRHSAVLLAPRDSSRGARRYLNSEEVVHRQYRHDMRRYVKKYNIGAAASVGNSKSRRSSKSGSSSSAAHKESTGAIIPPPPTLKRLPLCDSLQSLFEVFPVSFTDNYESALEPTQPSTTKQQSASKEAQTSEAKGSRMLYRSVMLGPDVQVLLLDMRGSAEEGGAAYLGKEQSAWLKAQLLESMCLWKVIVCGYSFGVVGVDRETSLSAAPSPSKPASPALKERERTNSAPSAIAGAKPAQTASASESNEEVSRPALTSSKSVKLFQIAEPDLQESSVTAPLLDEDLDEVYSRSKHSLPYVLGRVQKTKFSSLAQTQSETIDHKEVSAVATTVTSGIVVLSGGMCKVVQRDTAITPPHHGEVTQETNTPLHISAYATVLGTPSNEYRLMTDCSEDSGADAFCVEIGLGSSDAGVSSSSGGGGVRVDHGFLSGLEAQVLFSDNRVKGKSLTSSCQLSLRSDGSLLVRVIAADLSSPGAAHEKGVALKGRVLHERILKSAALSLLPNESSLLDGEDSVVE